MRKYCIDAPCCPNCYEPYNTGSSLLKVNITDLCQKCQFCFKEECPHNIYKFKQSLEYVYYCNKCGSYFTNNVNLEDYDSIKSILLSKEKDIIQPVYRNIDLNILEKQYIGWFIKEDRIGKYFITLPYDNLNFIYLLISEVFIKNHNKKIVILEQDTNNLNENPQDIIIPNTDDLINSINYYEISNNQIPQEIKKESKNFAKNLKKNILLKMDKLHYHLSFNNDIVNADFSEDKFQSNIKLTPGEVKKHVEELYGKNTVSKIKILDKKDKIYKNEDALFDIKITEENQWGGKLKFNSSNYFNILNNIETLIPIRQLIKYQHVINENIDGKNNLYLMNYELENKIKIINEINPDIIIIKDTENIYDNRILNDITNLVENIDSTILFFSVNKNNRLFYLNKLTKLNSITYHTFDSENILKYLISQETDTKKNNLFTPQLKNENIANIKHEIYYYEINELDPIEFISNQILSDLKEINVDTRELRSFFDLLIKTPIQVMDKEYSFSYNHKDIYYWLEVLIDINPNYNIETYDAFKYNFSEVYIKDNENYNPLAEKIISEIKLYSDQKNVLIYIVSPNRFYTKSIEKYINQKLNEKEIDKVKYCTWDEIESEYHYINQKIQIISTTKPPKNTNIHSKTFKNMIFIGSTEKIRYIKNNVERRLNKNNIKPFINVTDEENTPNILKEYIKTIPKTNIIEIDEMKEVYINDLIIDGSTKQLNNNPIKIKSDKHTRKLKEKEDVILLIDSNNEGIYLPLNHTITYKKDNTTLDNILIKNNSLDKVINKTILLDNGFYTTYKEFFTRFMIEYGNKINFKLYGETIVGFISLLQKSNEWINNFRKLLQIEEKNNNINFILDKEEHVANKLQEYGANVKPKYIKKYWLEDPIKLTVNNEIIEMYSVEHLRNVKSLIEIYKNLNENYIEFTLDESDALKTYQAAQTIQRIRRSFIKNKNILPKYNELYYKFKHEIINIIKNSESFKVSSCQKVKLKEEVKPYVRITDYEKYI